MSLSLLSKKRRSGTYLTKWVILETIMQYFSGDLPARGSFALLFIGSTTIRGHENASNGERQLRTKMHRSQKICQPRVRRRCPLEESSAREGKYAWRHGWGKALPAKQDKVELTPAEVEAKIRFAPLRSGSPVVVGERRRQSLVSGNGSVSGTSRIVDMTEEKVVFAYHRAEAKVAIEFFGAPDGRALRQATTHSVRQPRPDGRSWHHVAVR